LSDPRLRELERKFRATGSPEDKAAWQNERARQGLSPRVPVLELSTRIVRVNLGDDASWLAFMSAVTAAEDDSAQAVLLDCTQLIHTDSFMLGKFVEISERRPKWLVLCGVRPLVRTLFETIGFSGLLTLADSVALCLEENRWERSRTESICLIVED
jgi:anti-anti-sigma regulatory factor